MHANRLESSGINPENGVERKLAPGLAGFLYGACTNRIHKSFCYQYPPTGLFVSGSFAAVSQGRWESEIGGAPRDRAAGSVVAWSLLRKAEFDQSQISGTNRARSSGFLLADERRRSARH